MDLLTTLPPLMRETVRAALRALPRAGWVLAHLAVTSLVYLLLAGVISRVGAQQPLVGGLVLGAVQALFTGWHLALLEIAVLQKRKVKLADLSEQSGSYFWEVISIGFLFMLVQLVTMAVAPALWLPIALVSTLVFSPVPELMVTTRSQSLPLLREAARFMQQGWPEWLALHLIALAAFAPVALVAGPQGVPLLLSTAIAAGPHLSLPTPGMVALGALPPTATAALTFALLVLWLELLLIARLTLARTLGTGSRRSRAWRQRL